MKQKNANKKLKEKKLNDKIKSLILLSLIHSKMYKYKYPEVENVFLINKEYLNSYYFSEINKLIKENEIIQDKLKNIQLKEISENNLIKFIEDLDYNTFKDYNKKISKVKNKIKISYNVKMEEIKLSESTKTFVYKDFCVIYKANNIYKLFEKNFEINFPNSDISFITIKENDIIVDNTSNITFLLNSNDEKISYNIEYILVPKKNDRLFLNQILDMETFGYINNFNKKFSFNKEDNNEDLISTIFVDDKIIGNCYKYISGRKDYKNLNDYTKYLEYEALTNILSLYSYYILKKKATISINQCEKYYLVNSKFMNEIKIDNNFREIYNCLEKNINNIYIEEKANKKNLYFLIKNLPLNLLEEFGNNKISKEYNIDDIMPLQAEINYNEKEPLLIYDNFEIIDANILDKFVKNYKNDKIFVDCTFNEGKIIINLPDDLNKNIFVSLIGYIKDDEFNNFVLEYILIFKDEKERQLINFNIIFDFNNYLNSLKYNKKCYKNEEKNVIIAKYDNENIVDKYESDIINN